MTLKERKKQYYLKPDDCTQAFRRNRQWKVDLFAVFVGKIVVSSHKQLLFFCTKYTVFPKLSR